MGSGKTTTSRLLKERLKGTALLSLADIKRFISNFDENHDYNRISQEIILVMADEYLKRGINIIVEWAMKEERVFQLKEIASKNNSSFHFYKLNAPKEVLIERVKNRTKEILKVDELPERNLQNLESNFEENYSFHLDNNSKEGVEVNSVEFNSHQIVEIILNDLSR